MGPVGSLVIENLSPLVGVNLSRAIRIVLLVLRGVGTPALCIEYLLAVGRNPAAGKFEGIELGYGVQPGVYHLNGESVEFEKVRSDLKYEVLYGRTFPVYGLPFLRAEHPVSLYIFRGTVYNGP